MLFKKLIFQLINKRIFFSDKINLIEILIFFFDKLKALCLRKKYELKSIFF